MNKVELFKSYTSYRKLPLNYNLANKVNFELEFEKLIEPSFLIEFLDASINYFGIVICNYQVVKESLYHISAQKKYGIWYLLKSLFVDKKVHIDEDVVLIFNEWGTGYGHWITESLPRLFSIKDRIKENTVVLLPDNVNASVISSLKLFNVSNIRFIEQGTIVKAKRVLMPTLIAQTGNYNDSCMRALNHYLRARINIVNPPNSKERVYLSRAKANKRKIVNEDSLIDLLKHFGFRIVYVEDLSFDEQVNIFFNTDFLVSIHGATLANMMFMEKGSNVLEIRNRSDIRSLCYYSLASALDINYYYIFADPISEALSNNSDLKIDINAFEKLLKSVFA